MLEGGRVTAIITASANQYSSRTVAGADAFFTPANAKTSESFCE